MMIEAPWAAICGYDRARVPEAALRAFRFVHPLRSSADESAVPRASSVPPAGVGGD
jgi:hypothetical protein